MHVAWEVQTNPTYTITLTLRGEELAEFHRLVCEADKSLHTTPCQASILRDLSNAIREATQQEK